MMNFMKWYVALLAAALTAQTAPIGDVKTVYLLPMSSSLDQYLAMHLTAGNVLQVVTDPKKADAILSDRIGATLDQKLDDLYGKSKPKPKDSMDDSPQPVIQPVSRARGMIFLIDRKTRNVLWSVYERPKTTSPDDLNRAADKIAAKLSKDLKGK